MWTIFKAFNFLQHYFYFFMFLFFGHKACGIIAFQSRIKPTPPALEGEVLTTELPGNFPGYSYLR